MMVEMLIGAVEPGVVIAIIAAFAAPVATYAVTVRRLSGKVETTDAKDLWTAQESLREWAAGRIDTLTEEVDRLRKRLSDLEERNASLSSTIAEQRETIYKLRDELMQAKGAASVAVSQVTSLEAKLDRARQRVEELEGRGSNN